jgi:hypothetical protein
LRCQVCLHPTDCRMRLCEHRSPLATDACTPGGQPGYSNKGFSRRRPRRILSAGCATSLVTCRVDVVCPICTAAVLRITCVSDTIVVGACDECATLFTVQLGALRHNRPQPSPGLVPPDSSPSSG